MVNPILNAISQNKIAPIKNMMQMLRNSQNPQAMVSQILQSNPQIANLIQANGGDAQKAFYSMANKLGVDGDEIMSMLK